MTRHVRFTNELKMQAILSSFYCKGILPFYFVSFLLLVQRLSFTVQTQDVKKNVPLLIWTFWACGSLREKLGGWFARVLLKSSRSTSLIIISIKSSLSIALEWSIRAAVRRSFISRFDSFNTSSRSWIKLLYTRS